MQENLSHSKGLKYVVIIMRYPHIHCFAQKLRKNGRTILYGPQGKLTKSSKVDQETTLKFNLYMLILYID